MRHSFRFSSIARAACVVFIVGCNDPAQPFAQGEIRLAALTFARIAPSGADVRYTVANPSATSVRITTRCGDALMPAIEQLSGNRWRQYSSGGCLAIYDMSPVDLDPGAQREGVVHIRESGQYRLVLGTDGGSLVSSAFTIE